MSFWGEVKRRRVFQVTVVYAVVAWLLVQVAVTVEEPLGLPGWLDTLVITLVILGLPLAVLLSWAYDVTSAGIVRTRPEPSGGSEGQAPSPPVEAQSAPRREVLKNSIAVLPFENMSPDPNNAYFAAGIHEEILNSLAKLKSLNVISRTSVLQYAQTTKPIAAIAGELGVETVMEGSVRYAGNRVRVTTQLIDAITGAHLWSEAYEREFDDIFAIQADIAENVANELQAEFSSEEKAKIAQPATTSTPAYGLYLQFLSTSASADPSRAHRLLDQALELDPKFALALGGKAAIYAQELINTAGGSAGEQAKLPLLIRKSAAATLALDPKNGNAHSALGLLAALTWHWTEAIKSCRIAGDSTGASVFRAAANWVLSWSGNSHEAIEYAQRIARLSPGDFVGPWNLGIVLNYDRQYAAAAAAFRDSIAIAPVLPIQRSWLALTEIAYGDSAAAANELELTEQFLGDNRPIIFLLDMAYGYGRIGDQVSASRIFDEIQGIAAEHEIGAGGWAMANMAIENYAEALKWLRIGAEKAARHEIDAGMFSLMNLKLNVTADPVLEQAEFVDVRNRLKGD